MIPKKSIILIFLVTFVYLSLFAITFWILMPLQVEIAEKYITYGKITTLLVLPHGFRVILTWLWRGRAVVFLLPGAAIQSLVVVRHYDLGTADGVAMALSFSCCSFAAFEVARWFGMDAYASRKIRANWRGVLAVGALAGLINGIVNMLFVFSRFPMSVQLWVALNLFVGGMFGLMVWLLALRFALRRLVRRTLLFPCEE